MRVAIQINVISPESQPLYKNNSIDIEKPKGGDKKKRIVLIDDDLKSWIRTYIRKEGRTKGYIFRSNLKKQISNRYIRSIIKDIGEKLLDWIFIHIPCGIPLQSIS